PPPPPPPADALAPRLDAPLPPPLQLAEGDSFIGTITGLSRGATKHGIRPIVRLVDDHGQEGSLWLLHTALRAGFRRLKPRKDDRIGVKRLGERTPKHGGKPYVDWRVLRADDGPLDWDAALEDDEE